MKQIFEQKLTFGPVPSRRLGRSLGINNIPPKVCPYACGYCQLGRTIKMQIERQAFYAPEEILKAVREKVNRAKAAGETVDYLTFVPDGEPTLDLNLGREIELLRPLGLPIAVITNAALIWDERVRAALGQADWVSLKVDAVHEDVWRQLDRPHGTLPLAAILDGTLKFAAGFKGQLVTETMLVEGINDSPALIEETADFVARLQPDTAYLAIPTRPPAEKWVQAPGEEVITRAYQILRERVDRVEYLIGYEGNAFAFTGDVEADLLSITAVHPMREEAVGEFLVRANVEWSMVRHLIEQGQLVETKYDGQKFYVRRLHAPT
jgi:wyosine [tRNA(Phe)-imidazoG37] synthetase (radical SAM superfamily)